ncbi:MAG: hypothetical protein RML12_03380 [Xanthomonadales bacterium]|nr:hypothetical protein [Xanthomonadales bacterium]
MMLRCRRPWLAFGIGWFFLGHAITAAPLPLELAFEHRNYLPSFGLVVALADLLALAAATLNRPLVAAGALAAWTLWQAAVAATLALDWRDPLVHAEACRQRAPESARAHYEFARLLYPASEGLAPEASPRREMREALLLAARLPSGTGLAEVALIGDAGRHGEPTEAWWWDSLARRLSGRGVAVSQNRAVADLAKCVFERRCAADDPGLARLVRVRLGTGPWVRDDALLLGWIAYRVLQDWEAAAMQLERAEAEGGLDPNSRLALADALVRLGDEAAARALLERHGVPYVALEGFRMAVWVLPAAVEPSPDQGGGHPPP